MHHRTKIALALLLTASVACKKKAADESGTRTDPPPAVVTTSDAGTAVVNPPAGDFPFGTGETYFGGTRGATNVHEWKVADGSVHLVVVDTGKGADGRREGRLRAYRDGKATDVGSTFTLVTTGEHWTELKQLPNGRVLFRYGDASDDPRARNAMVLRYDEQGKDVRVSKRWAGRTGAKEPAWLGTGEYTREGTGDLCEKVVARVVACEKDPKFRTSLMVREAEGDRAGLLESFDKDVATWRKAADAKKQCERWASDDYVETTFSDPAKLENLAKDASDPKLSCELFGAEIVDEGGLPRLAGK